MVNGMSLCIFDITRVIIPLFEIELRRKLNMAKNIHFSNGPLALYEIRNVSKSRSGFNSPPSAIIIIFSFPFFSSSLVRSFDSAKILLPSNPLSQALFAPIVASIYKILVCGKSLFLCCSLHSLRYSICLSTLNVLLYFWPFHSFEWSAECASANA